MQPPRQLLESSGRQYVNEGAWLCSMNTLFMDSEIWISYNFYELRNIQLLIFFSSHLKVWKLFLAHEPHKNRRLVGFGSWARVCWPSFRAGSAFYEACDLGQITEMNLSDLRDKMGKGTMRSTRRDRRMQCHHCGVFGVSLTWLALSRWDMAWFNDAKLQGLICPPKTHQ